MIWFDLGLFFFVLLGSKLLAGAITVYLLLPQDPRCVICDAEMLTIEPVRGMRRLLHALRLERRWCMECRRETLARLRASRPAHRQAPRPVPEPRVR
jgi:hypothetical protein